jgi:hypothetical protein
MSLRRPFRRAALCAYHEESVTSNYPFRRYWALSGLAGRGCKRAQAHTHLKDMHQDVYPEISAWSVLSTGSPCAGRSEVLGDSPCRPQAVARADSAISPRAGTTRPCWVASRVAAMYISFALAIRWLRAPHQPEHLRCLPSGPRARCAGLRDNRA